MNITEDILIAAGFEKRELNELYYFQLWTPDDKLRLVMTPLTEEMTNLDCGNATAWQLHIDNSDCQTLANLDIITTEQFDKAVRVYDCTFELTEWTQEYEDNDFSRCDNLEHIDKSRRIKSLIHHLSHWYNINKDGDNDVPVEMICLGRDIEDGQSFAYYFADKNDVHLSLLNAINYGLNRFTDADKKINRDIWKAMCNYVVEVIRQNKVTPKQKFIDWITKE